MRDFFGTATTGIKTGVLTIEVHATEMFAHSEASISMIFEAVTDATIETEIVVETAIEVVINSMAIMAMEFIKTPGGFF